MYCVIRPGQRHVCQNLEAAEPTFPQWALFPAEIRLKVFEILAEDAKGNSKSHIPKKTGLAAYSMGCKEWQVFFEKRLYQYLSLTQWSLYNFDVFVRRQRALVEHIWLCIELTTYGCPACMKFVNTRGDTDHNIVAQAISKLFFILSTWKKSEIGVGTGNRVTLELSIYSPSDSQHVFKGDLHFGMHPFAGESGEPRIFATHDPYHGWASGKRISHPEIAGIDRVLEPLFPKFRCGLASVEVVQSLIIRRQTRRRLHSFGTLKEIIESLPNLMSINYEPWRVYYPLFERAQDRGYEAIIMNSLPETLKVLTLFEDFKEDYNIAYCFGQNLMNWGEIETPTYIRVPSPSIAATLARKITGFEKVYVSYIVDADDFFKTCEPDWMWQNLTSLALTSWLLTQSPRLSAINNLLLRAGKAALKMPKLQRMDIWYALKRKACAFRYQATPEFTKISWCGTRDIEFDPDVVDVWGEVAKLHTEHELSVEPNRILEYQYIKSHAAAIRALEVNEEVIHPVSLEQVERESSRWYFP